MAKKIEAPKIDSEKETVYLEKSPCDLSLEAIKRLKEEEILFWILCHLDDSHFRDKIKQILGLTPKALIEEKKNNESIKSAVPDNSNSKYFEGFASLKN